MFTPSLHPVKHQSGSNCSKSRDTFWFKTSQPSALEKWVTFELPDDSEKSADPTARNTKGQRDERNVCQPEAKNERKISSNDGIEEKLVKMRLLTEKIRRWRTSRYPPNPNQPDNDESETERAANPQYRPTVTENKNHSRRYRKSRILETVRNHVRVEQELIHRIHDIDMLTMMATSANSEEVALLTAERESLAASIQQAQNDMAIRVQVLALERAKRNKWIGTYNKNVIQISKENSIERLPSPDHKPKTMSTNTHRPLSSDIGTAVELTKQVVEKFANEAEQCTESTNHHPTLIDTGNNCVDKKHGVRELLMQRDERSNLPEPNGQNTMAAPATKFSPTSADCPAARVSSGGGTNSRNIVCAFSFDSVDVGECKDNFGLEFEFKDGDFREIRRR